MTPYTLLRITPDATAEEIEAAYQRMFDQFETKAQTGDADAVAMLERLNEAYDTLGDPESRAELDAELEGRVDAPVLAAKPSRASRAERPSGNYSSARSSASVRDRARSGGQSLRGRERVRRYSRPVPDKPVLPLVPIMLIGLLAFALAVAITYFLVTRNSTAQAENRGSVVATVNDQPIYEQDYLERAEQDKQAALDEPLLGALDQEKVMETVKSDALDRLINFEVLMQQAKKEGLFPPPDEQRSVIEEAKSREVRGVSFAEFLKQRNITEGQYDRRVIRNYVYAIMANAHMPKEGTAEERRAGYFQWICQARQSYTVKINISFTVDNPPCTSDLPPDVPLPGLDNIPQPEGTVVP